MTAAERLNQKLEKRMTKVAASLHCKLASIESLKERLEGSAGREFDNGHGTPFAVRHYLDLKTSLARAERQTQRIIHAVASELGRSGLAPDETIGLFSLLMENEDQ